jgi:hypothetical protein
MPGYRRCNEYLIRCRFKELLGDASLHAIMVKAHSVALSAADVERSLFSCCAPTFEFDRRGQVYCLCCRPFCFPRFCSKSTECGFCFSPTCRGSRASFHTTACDTVRSLCPPAS